MLTETRRRRKAPPALALRRWSYLLQVDMWKAWRSFFSCDDSATAVLVWLANKRAKAAPDEARALFYSVKDAFIRRYGTQGRKAWREGRNHDSYAVWIYEHEMWVAGSYYRFHSTVAPKVEVEKGGASGAFETGIFLDDGLAAALTLPMSGYLKLLCYVAAAKWGMVREGGVFVERDGS